MTEKEKKNCTNHENVVEETPKDKKGVIVWIKAHRKQLILGKNGNIKSSNTIDNAVKRICRIMCVVVVYKRLLF